MTVDEYSCCSQLLIFLILAFHSSYTFSFTVQSIVLHNNRYYTIHSSPNNRPSPSTWTLKLNYSLSQQQTIITATMKQYSTLNDNHENQENDEKNPHFTFGVIADIQYAPIPNGHSYSGVPRYYRHALDTARHAATHFENDKVSIVVNLGDIIDGKCQDVGVYIKEEKEKKKKEKNEALLTLAGNVEDEQKLLLENDKKEEDEEEEEREEANGHTAICEVLDALKIYQTGPILHTYGNHELYNLSREDIGLKMNIPFVREPCGELVGYYTYSIPSSSSNQTNHHPPSSNKATRFIVLDSYDITYDKQRSVHSHKHQKAVEILSQRNPNYPQAENSPEGLTHLDKRYVAFNGAVDKPQMEWLRHNLQKAKENKEVVIIVSHQPILPESSSPICLIWNYQDVIDILREFKCVIAAAFAGHAHKGGYKRDDVSGIHFRVFEAVLESKEPIKTYAFVDVFDDRLVVRGFGNCQSAVYDLDHMLEDS